MSNIGQDFFLTIFLFARFNDPACHVVSRRLMSRVAFVVLTRSSSHSKDWIESSTARIELLALQRGPCQVPKMLKHTSCEGWGEEGDAGHWDD